ncbi:hypothetical protein KPN3_26 [Klebsiella phage KPN3]|uniref:Uncharacterized protein n=1 Tax=Klebsiella phage KPN3 TaxID=2601621 RepID=A0A5B9NC00_9CAUD|nr:hypothetical protein KPN3_26 [Klebsiella phage KPN3]
MKDFLGNDIEIGDTIVYADAGGRRGSSGLNKTVVTRMTDKQVMVYESTWSKLWRPFDRVVVVAKGGSQ